MEEGIQVLRIRFSESRGEREVSRDISERFSSLVLFLAKHSDRTLGGLRCDLRSGYGEAGSEGRNGAGGEHEGREGGGEGFPSCSTCSTSPCG